MRRDLAIVLAGVLASVLVLSAALAANATPGAAPGATPDGAPAAPPPAAQASITARAHVIAAGPGRAAVAASESLLSGAEIDAATTGDGLAQITWSRARAPDGRALLIEFVAN